ncbi:MAG: aminoglycoside phosphotransferase family protein [Clostridiales bacterium]|nr:aminoglycoside phosphotransferase family protein [Clostridiales bacterium]
MFDVLKQFCLDGTPVSCERYGNGHINETYLAVTDKNHLYILQKINHHIFKDVPALMQNIASVTGYLFDMIGDPRRVLTLVKTVNGGHYLCHGGHYFRVYEFVTDSICLDRAESRADFYNSAVAFGQFQNQLSLFPADTLSETIPRFHDTPNRYTNFKNALKEDKLGRAASVQKEIDFVLAREEDAAVMMNLLKKGELPLRVTHNDTKLNNVMLDKNTRTPLCVIDLDTVMPGLAANDFGDSIRFGASTAAEDETDLDKVTMSLDLFDAYTSGFLGACGKNLTALEKETLPLGAKLMTLECGVRFLTDYLEGDTYFRIHREHHNLDRCRTQFKLVADMENKWQEMARIIDRYKA